MPSNHKVSEKRQKSINYDVIVVGGGMAGVSAAISASRNGASVLLVERHPYCGGALTAGMVLHIAGLVDHRRVCSDDKTILDSAGWIVQGLACEYYEGFKRFGAAHGPHWDYEPAKIILDQMLQEADVDVLYGTEFFSAITSGGMIKSIELIYRTEKITARAKMFIDATGDGDVGASAGVEYYCGRESDGAMMPATLSFMVAGVGEKTCNDIARANSILSEAWQKGEIPSDMRSAIITRRFSEGIWRNELWCSPVRQWGDITDPFEYSRMEHTGREIAWEIFRYLKSNVSGWQDAYLGSIAQQIWPRESRHLKALYTISGDDVRKQICCDDVIARGGFYLDLHSVKEGTTGFDVEWHPPEYDLYFEIPYRSLVASGVDNLLFAGRTIGADHLGHSATRVMGTGIATGQAAGAAAAMGVDECVNAKNLDVQRLQKTLRKQGVII